MLCTYTFFMTGSVLCTIIEVTSYSIEKTWIYVLLHGVVLKNLEPVPENCKKCGTIPHQLSWWRRTEKATRRIDGGGCAGRLGESRRWVSGRIAAAKLPLAWRSKTPTPPPPNPHKLSTRAALRASNSGRPGWEMRRESSPERVATASPAAFVAGDDRRGNPSWRGSTRGRGGKRRARGVAWRSEAHRGCMSSARGGRVPRPFCVIGMWA